MKKKSLVGVKRLGAVIVCVQSQITIARSESWNIDREKKSICSFAGWRNAILPRGRPKFSEFSDETPAIYDKSHYPNGLNEMFLGSCDQCAETYAGPNGRFEAESREIAKYKYDIIAMLREYGLYRGATVGDVGAGTGIITRIMSREVGAQGTVFAEDISNGFVSFINNLVTSESLTNVVVVEGSVKSTNLPDNESLDLVLVCDTYHHFEYPRTICRSIHKSMKPGSGRLVVIDFHRNDDLCHSKPRGWVMEHVRADRDVFINEIESAGFRLIAEPHVKGMTENYVLVFQAL
jgi:ubiquinone/menaquinone biosynthesis C-methylase UbiE